MEKAKSGDVTKMTEKTYVYMYLGLLERQGLVSGAGSRVNQ